MAVSKYLYKTIAWRGLVFVASFFLNLAIARVYGAAESGIFFYNISIYSLIILVVSLSLEAGLGFYANSEPAKVNRLFSFSILWFIIISVLLFVIFFSSFFFINPHKVVLLKALPFISGNILMTFMTGLFYARKHFVIPNVIMLVAYGILFLLLPGFLIKTISLPQYLNLYLWTYLFIAIIMALLFYARELKGNNWEWPGLNILKPLIKYAAIAWVGNIIFFFLYRVDYWFIEHYSGKIELGNYIQVSRLAQVFFLVPAIVASVIFPVTASSPGREMMKMLALISRLFFGLYIVTCAFIALTGRWLFPWLFGESYHAMYMPFMFLIPGILALSMLYPITAYFAGINKVVLNLKASAIALCFMIAGDIIFIPAYGIYAAAIVSSASYIIFHLILFFYLKKSFNIQVKSFFFIQKNDFSILKSYFTGSIKSHNGIQQ
ncbi:MAG: polysaccharide biosynthesis C-terminal domain-containing protein [Ferruginibacter sp.]